MKPPISSSSSSSFSSAISFLSPRKIGLSPFLFTTLTSIIIISILYKEGYTCIFQQRFNQLSGHYHDQLNTPLSSSSSSSSSSNNNINGARVAEKWKWKDRESSWLRQPPFAIAERRDWAAEEGECDVFSGKWVKDELNRPLYEETECPYIQPQLTCQEHGRPDKDYQSWRWQPHSCSLPSFNATFMLERLRGKRMMFVGDSLNRGQYVSMVCLLQRVIPEKARFMKTFDSLTVFRAEEYNATIEFYWAPFLLESNSDNAVVHRVPDRMIRKGSINKHGRHWKGVDILVFNTYLWWMTGKKMKFLEGSFDDDDEDKVIIEMETEDAYRLAITSMVNWLERNTDPGKTRVFFTSMSPYHEKSVEWGDEAGGNCYNQTTPIEDPSYWGSGSRKSIMQVIEEVFSESEVPITFLNITQLSEYRKDAHTSIYKKQWNPLTAEQLANPVSYVDCVHWCLPGLQDTWNELLYTKLFYP